MMGMVLLGGKRSGITAVAHSYPVSDSSGRCLDSAVRFPSHPDLECSKRLQIATDGHEKDS